MAQAAQLAALCRQVEVAFGFPVDVEWALSGGSFSLLQARPITALPAAPVPIALEVPEGDWDRDDHHAVISPLGWAWIQPYAKGMTRMMNELGVPVTEMRFARIGGRLYIRMVSPGGDAVPPRWVLWLVSRLLPSLRKANRLASHLLDDAGFLLAQKRWENETRPQFQAERARLDLADPSTLDDDALLARIQAAMDLCAKGLILHSELHTPGFAGLGRLALFLSDELQGPMDRAFDLVAGASPATTQKNADLRALLQAHHDELEGRGLPRTWSALQRDCPRLGAALSAWLRDNRLHMQHYDPANPTLGERPELLLAVLEGLRAEDGNRSAGTGTADAVAKEALAALPAERREAFLQVLADARAVAGLRDENGIELVSLPAGLLRHFVLELGRRLPGLDEPSHVTYLYPEEHGPALRGQIADLTERITRRRGEESWARRQRLPRRYGKPKPPMPDLSAFPEPMARLLRIFDWVDRAETLPEPSEDGDALRGVGVGTGLVVGRVRVLRGPDELSLLRRGEIAVCRITSPEWALGLDRMAGLITDEGGSLSHPAIIARELAIPAVLGTELATSRLRTGDRVELDAVSGTVRLLAGSRVDGGGTGASADHRESRQSTT